jgi:hypothetical protein
MFAKYGEPALADLNIRHGSTRQESSSPIESKELQELPFADVVNRLASWKPDQPPFAGLDLEDLASTFGQYLSGKTEMCSAEAGALVGRHPVFVRTFLSQMAEAAKASLPIHVVNVLSLCKWVTEQPLSLEPDISKVGGMFVDQSWQWTRDEISRFVENVCQAMDGEKPRYGLSDIKQPMWELLEKLYRDPAKSTIVQDTSQDDPRVNDYLDLGINSPRGKAVGAALEYARWVAHHVKEPDGKQGVVPAGFSAMSEVRDMLQWQIAEGNRTLEAMSVIGSKIALIFWIDKDWLATNVDVWLESAKQILGLAMNASATVRQQAISLIELLGRHGHTDFGELLKGKS